LETNTLKYVPEGVDSKDYDSDSDISPSPAPVHSHYYKPFSCATYSITSNTPSPRSPAPPSPRSPRSSSSTTSIASSAPLSSASASSSVTDPSNRSSYSSKAFPFPSRKQQSKTSSLAPPTIQSAQSELVAIQSQTSTMSSASSSSLTDSSSTVAIGSSGDMVIPVLPSKTNKRIHRLLKMDPPDINEDKDTLLLREAYVSNPVILDAAQQIKALGKFQKEVKRIRTHDKNFPTKVREMEQRWVPTEQATTDAVEKLRAHNDKMEALIRELEQLLPNADSSSQETMGRLNTLLSGLSDFKSKEGAS